MHQIDLTRILEQAHIPELPNPYYGKVRDCYDVAGNQRVLISSDRISAFDRNLAAIPFKGQVLTQTAQYWFEQTSDICANHVLSYPDPNVVIGQKLRILPIEIVVRGYLAGNTSTSILTQYQQGKREIYGHHFPENLRANEALAKPIITPTTKALDGAHDAPLTVGDIFEQNLVSKIQWEELSSYAFALFNRGQTMAAKQGLILVDTKYEFGIDQTGVIMLADEIHTPDSSRYWIASGYESALANKTRPPSFDKDVIRSWVADRCDPYHDPIPSIPADMILHTANVYIDAYQAITGQNFVPDTNGATPLDRIRKNLAYLFEK